MAPVVPDNMEFALSIVSSTAVADAKDLCNLLAVSKGLQAAIISKGANSSFELVFKANSNSNRTITFAYWLQKYHMLVAQLRCSSLLDVLPDWQPDDDATQTAVLSFALRPPLQLTALHITHRRPLKLLQQVDAKLLTTLRLSRIMPDSWHSADALTAAIGQLTNLQELILEKKLTRAPAKLCSLSGLAQLTALTGLSLDRFKPSPADWQHIPSQLQRLRCHRLDDEALSNMHHLVQLQVLILYEPFVTGVALAAAARHMPQLAELEMEGYYHSAVHCEQLQALGAMPCLRRLEVLCLPDLTMQHVVNIAQASSLTSLVLCADGAEEIALDLSGWTALRQLRDLTLEAPQPATLGSFGDMLTYLNRLRSMNLRLILGPAALAQVLSATQLTGLNLDCRVVFPDDVTAMPGGMQLGMVASHLKQLRRLHIHCDTVEQHELVTMLKGPWLPQLQELVLCNDQEEESGERFKEWCSVIQRVRPTLEVGCCYGGMM